MKFAIDRPECQGDQVRIFLKCLLQTLIVAAVVEGLNAARDLESAGETGHDVAISLAVSSICRALSCTSCAW